MTIRLRQLAIDVAALRSELQDGDLANVRWLVNVNRWLMIAFSSVAMIFIVLLVKEARDARRAERQALASEQRTRHVAEHDLLTDLPNRLMFHRLLSDALERTQARGSAAALILCDIDDFREINETLGHDLGDTLLVATARRLRSLLGEGDVLARLGSDEFAILRPQAADMPAGTAADSAAAIEGLRAAFDAPFIWGDRTVSVTLSFGIACFPRDAGDVESLLRAADLALQTAKAEDRRCVRVYRPEMSRDLLERKALEADLQAAIAAGDIEVHFQPQIRLADGRFLGAEALARWRHPERGWISPGVFIPLAEKSGLIGALAEQVLETACREALRWPGGAGADSIVAVNVSPAQFAYEDVFSQVQAVLARIPFPARRLELEITEGLLMRDVRAALVILDQFSALGIRLAIDDFGTGYSSLNYLKHFPLHKLKIDQSFVRDLLNSDSDRMIVETIVSLAVGLGLRTIAEGIETEAHHQLLRELGCDEGQGYWYGRPMPGDDLLAWLAAWEDRPTDVAARSERAA
jgi:diguanylate cyclase (GGDEF)-like protein